MNDPEVGATLTINVPELPDPIVTDEVLVPSVQPLEPPPEPEPPTELFPQLIVALTPLEILFVTLGFPTACT